MVIHTQTPPMASVENVAPHVQKFIDFYQQLDRNNLERLPEIYHPDIRFTDPLHHIQGLSELQDYFAGMYDGVLHIEFEILRQTAEGEQACVEWCMHYQHQKLKQGQTIHVQGMSWLHFDDGQKIINHRDYFDAGQMLYEHLPVIGRVIRYLKRRISP